MTAKEVLEISPIVPVVAIKRAEDALALAKALLEGGIRIMEITLRTEAGLKAIEIISKELPQMHVGAGTVLNKEDFEKAVAHGASFVFSPGISQELMDVSKALNIPLIPGVATASEVMLAQNNGFRYCKLFPGTLAGGVAILKAFSGPFPAMRFCPTGGVNAQNVEEFLALDNVVCVGGTWIIPDQAIKDENFDYISRLCEDTLKKC